MYSRGGKFVRYITRSLLPDFTHLARGPPSSTIAGSLVMASRIILITGANRGLGFCIAQVLAQKNVKDTVIVTARVQDSASQAIQKLEELGAKTHLDSTVLDVASDQSIHALVSMIQERYGRLDGMSLCPKPILVRPKLTEV